MMKPSSSSSANTTTTYSININHNINNKDDNSYSVSSEPTIVVDGEIIPPGTGPMNSGTGTPPTSTAVVVPLPKKQHQQQHQHQQQQHHCSCSKYDQYPELLDMKLRRKRRTVTFGVVGGVAGLILLGPIGGVVGGLAGAYGTKAAGKRREKEYFQSVSSTQQQHQ